MKKQEQERYISNEDEQKTRFIVDNYAGESGGVVYGASIDEDGVQSNHCKENAETFRINCEILGITPPK